jgi:hypothetical protein
VLQLQFVSSTVFGLGITINEILKGIGRFRESKIIREIIRRNYLIFKKHLLDQAEAIKSYESLITPKSAPNFNAYILACSTLDNYKDISYNNSF